MAFKHVALLVLVVLFPVVTMSTAGDPDIMTDFIIPENNATADASFFTFTSLRTLVGADPTNFTTSRINMAEFPALNGQSVEYVYEQFPGGTMNPPHSHPRSSELVFVLSGSLEVGFADTGNKLYTQTLKAGDMFVIPKGVVHYQYNADTKNSATAIVAFESANAGIVPLPNHLFTTGIDDNILAKSFKTDVAIIQAIKAGMAPVISSPHTPSLSATIIFAISKPNK